MILLCLYDKDGDISNYKNKFITGNGILYMKRLCIFVLYDKNGEIDSYIDHIVISMQNFVQKIILVINGCVEEVDRQRLQKHAVIFVRANEGFDAGAYKDVLLKYIPRAEWSAYDEIILMNDTFYGPFYPMEELWKTSERLKADFWGITRHPDGLYSDGQDMPSHIQGYFLAIRKQMLHSEAFVTFWKEMPDLCNIYDTIKEFEVRFTTYFEGLGFVGKTLMEIGNPSLSVKYNENPYLTHSFCLIRNQGIPFLKKKALFFQAAGYEETIDAIEYIEKEQLYDTNLIWENIFRLCREKQFTAVFNYFELEKFYESHARIYIYGAGKYGKRIKRYFEYRNWEYECFLVSKEEDVIEGCTRYDTVMIEPTDGIIMALGNKNLDEVLRLVKNMISNDQMFLPESVVERPVSCELISLM